MIGLGMAKVARKPAGLLLATLLLAALSPLITPATKAQQNAVPAPNSFAQTVHQAVQQAIQQTTAAQQAQGPASPVQLTPEQVEEITRMALRPGGPAQMGIAVAILVPIAFFAMVVLIAFFISRRRGTQIRAQAELRKQLIDKFGSAQELAAFLESKGGQQFFEDMRHTGGGPLRFLPGGIVVSMLGLAFLGLTTIHRPFIIPGVLLLAIGIGLLLSAAIGHKVACGGTGGVGHGSASGVPSLPRV